MTSASITPACQDRVWPWRLAAILLILGAAALRVMFLAVDCPFDLSPDEAHYWDWSRHLDWSYYSKGPLVAFLIHLSCWLTGGWSMQLTGSEMLAVRLPAVVCGGLLLAGMYTLTVQVFQRERLALGLVAGALTVPLITAGSMLMTIDSPYTCLWCWALVLGHRAIFERSAWAWPALGLVIGLGILAKYTMILWFASLGLFLLFTPEYRNLILRPGLWICLLIAGLCSLPILFWNAAHDWVGLWHVRQLAGVSQDESCFQWRGPGLYLTTQFGLLMGLWFLVWVRGMWANRPWRETDGPRCYLWWMSAFTFVFFLAFSFTTNGCEPNWPVASYLSGMVLAGGWLAEEGKRVTGWHRMLFRGGIATACVLGITLTALLHLTPRLTPVLAALVPPPDLESVAPIRRLDPTTRMRGWQTLARALDQEIDRLRSQGIEPIVAGCTWNLPGELAFYSRRKPEVYSLGLALGYRHSQYDFWRPNPVADPDRFMGRTFLFVGDHHELLNTNAFDEAGPTTVIRYQEGGVPVAVWRITVFRGFRGFPVNSANGKRF